MFESRGAPPQGLESLATDQCWELLGQTQVGRVGVSIGALPAIFPVNYAVVDRCSVFRTAPGTKLAAATAGAVVAFQVDDYRGEDRSGWSVLAVGPARVVHDRDVRFEVLASGPDPWADGTRTNVVSIAPGFLSGRRLVHQ
jgi:uncharacterized protein